MTPPWKHSRSLRCSQSPRTSNAATQPDPRNDENEATHAIIPSSCVTAQPSLWKGTPNTVLASDISRLDKPFQSSDPKHQERELEERLGIKTPNVRLLRKAVFSDLSTTPPYGIGWWLPQCEEVTPHRILIGDHILVCADSISTHLIAARIHWFHFLAHSENERYFPTRNSPIGPSRSPLDYLRRGPLAETDRDGLLRALCSALDCLAALTIGVYPLPDRIKTASFSRTFPRSPERHGHDPLAEIRATVLRHNAGGWLHWMLDYRNMLIHRGLRLQFHESEPDTTILGPSRIPARFRTRRHLPRSPSLSDIEAFVDADSAEAYMIREDARETLEGLLVRSERLIDDISARLLSRWTVRRDNPQVALQPFAQQWRQAGPNERSNFKGFSPDDGTVSGSSFLLNPSSEHRFSAALVTDDLRNLWDKPFMKGLRPAGVTDP